VRKPADMFDRDREWSALVGFARSGQNGATLGIVSGRRRQGKTFLLEALCREAGGCYFSAEDAAEAESLRYLGITLGGFHGSPGPIHLPDWRAAVDALLHLGRDREIPVVLDEFPYLVKASPSLPSVIQGALAPLRDERQESKTRLLLCGSALSFMGALLAGNAPLRGRAGLEMVVPTLDYRLAAEFWGINDPRLALKVNSITGGTPAYRREYIADDTPVGPDDFDAWVVRTVLNPYRPLFREARYLLAEEPDIRDTGLYHSILAAVADGNTTRGGIANYLGRKSSDLTHHLTVLEDTGLLLRDPELFHGKRTNYRISEPLITFYHGVMRPIWSELEHPRDPDRVWRRSQARYTSNVLGPHFEQVCREWARRYAELEHFGDYASKVGAGTVNDPANRKTHQIDVAVVGDNNTGRPPLLSIGEAKWNEPMDTGHLERLRHIKSLLAAQGQYDLTGTRLACYSAAGFTDGLRAAAAASPDVLLVGLAELYGR
jgi:uncharacterized protein